MGLRLDITRTNKDHPIAWLTTDAQCPFGLGSVSRNEFDWQLWCHGGDFGREVGGMPARLRSLPRTINLPQVQHIGLPQRDREVMLKLASATVAVRLKHHHQSIAHLHALTDATQQCFHFCRMMRVVLDSHQLTIFMQRCLSSVHAGEFAQRIRRPIHAHLLHRG